MIRFKNRLPTVGRRAFLVAGVLL